MKRITLAAALVLAPCVALAASPDPLPRRGALGVALEDAPGGARVLEVMSAASAKALGLKAGDVVQAVDGKDTPNSDALVHAMMGRPAGDKVKLKLTRDGKALSLEGRLAERPRETYAGGTVAYGAVPFQGGLLRDILVTPPGGAKGPVMFLIQGYTCSSVETAPGSSHQLLIEGLLARGISTYRVEKPGVGDSKGGPQCPDIDFKTEVAAFSAAYKALREAHGVPADRIVMLGHSLGGLEAPLLAAEGPSPRGVAVYGTVARSWRDYLLDVLKYQPFMASGADPAKAELDGEKARPLIERIYAKGESPTAIAAANAEDARLLKEVLGWDGGDRLMGRRTAFWTQISATPFLSAWRDTRAQVLTAYGESDFAAIDAEDHKLIADVANHYRPGTGRFVFVPRTGHGMRLDGTREEARARKPGAPAAAFNSDLVGLFGDWIESVMRAPPVKAD
ncbi:MAG: alpha/beta fold hydrolase [Pseudomonadota bacterium]